MFALLPVLLVFFQHQGTLPLFMVQELGFSEAVYGLMFTFNTLLIVLLEVRLNGAMAHWSYRRSLALGSFLCGLGFGALALATSLSALWQLHALGGDVRLRDYLRRPDDAHRAGGGGARGLPRQPERESAYRWGDLIGQRARGANQIDRRLALNPLRRLGADDLLELGHRAPGG